MPPARPAPPRSAPGARASGARALLGTALLLAACTDPHGLTGPRRAVSAAAVRHPVVFVHGWNASASTWTTMVDRFKADGYADHELLTWSYNTAQSNATTARQLQAKVDSVLAATGAAQVDLVSHSMGGLSTRYYVKNLGGAAKVDAFVSLAGANHGTQTAYACFQTACTEMWPNSRFLRTLNATDETPGAPRYATWWSPCDAVISPQRSTVLSDASNTQTACITHSQLHQDAAVYAQVRSWVEPGAAATVAALAVAPRPLEAAEDAAAGGGATPTVR